VTFFDWLGWGPMFFVRAWVAVVIGLGIPFAAGLTVASMWATDPFGWFVAGVLTFWIIDLALDWLHPWVHGGEFGAW